MSSSPESVECPECGESFDPAAAGGWCTNTDCGEYQWESNEEMSETTEPAEEAEPASPSESHEPADDLKKGRTEETSAQSQGPEEEMIECPNCGDSVPHMAYCKSCGEELPDEEPTESESEPATPTCPNCDEEIEEDWAACPFCGTS
jgi:DNA-directed RNA polymerase subunit RPC12/RpoP